MTAFEECFGVLSGVFFEVGSESFWLRDFGLSLKDDPKQICGDFHEGIH